jgi:hypothetical protein
MSYTNIEVSVDVEMMFASGEVHSFRLSGIPCKWVWGETSSRLDKHKILGWIPS